MAKLELRLCDYDRERWGGPEWLCYDHDAVLDTPADELDRWEQQIGVSLEVILREVGQDTARANRLVAWIAYQQAGITIPWAEFTPRTLRMVVRTVSASDADPPDQSSSTPSGPGLDEE